MVDKVVWWLIRSMFSTGDSGGKSEYKILARGG
jgi:hypothetical protein